MKEDKNILYAGFGFIILVISYLIYRKFTKPSAQDSALNKDINKNRLSFPESQYFILADTIQAATESIDVDEQSIYDVFSQMQNDSDVLQLIKAWGERTYLTIYGLLYNSPLTEALHVILSSSEVQKINDILKNNNISVTI